MRTVPAGLRGPGVTLGTGCWFRPACRHEFVLWSDMCGICGYVNGGGIPAQEAIVRAMTATLVPRGPDDEGIAISGPCALGMRRLAIVDPKGGRQPVRDETGQILAVCNGEIYNHRELRNELAKCGHRFRSGSDAEVLPHLYERFGLSFPTRLNGMFALAVWDAENRQLLLARDRMGQKPLYWCRTPSGLAFASEPKALLRHPEVVGNLSLAGLVRYLLYEYLPAPWTIYEGIFKLPRGHVLIWKDGRLRLERYWDPWPSVEQRRRVRARFSTPHAAAEELWRLLCRSVAARLMSDVPLGAFLSGGVDSAAVVAGMCAAGAEVQTYTIGFRDPSYDESAWAREVARHLGTQHHERIFDVRDLLDLLPSLGRYLDEPFGDASVLPTHLLSRFAREQVTVCLAGDGGDELLAGYPTFQAESVARSLRILPQAAVRATEGLLSPLPVSHANFSPDFVVRQFFRGLHRSVALTHQWWLGSFRVLDRLRLLTRDVLDEVEADLPERELISMEGDQFPPDDDWVNRLLWFYQETYLAEDILTKADRASMATGLEVRAPFLDPAIVEFVNALPGSWKLRGGTGKYLLKLAIRGRVPDRVLHRKKKGFGIPVAAWLCGELTGLVAELLAGPRLRRQGLFRPEVVWEMIRAHRARRANFRKQLWTLLMFQLWYDAYMDRFGGEIAANSGAEARSSVR